MKKYLFLTLLLVSSHLLYSSTPGKSTKELLMSYIWKLHNNDSFETLDQFTFDEIISTINTKSSKKIINEYYYYLSDDCGLKFDFSLVGQSNNGQYIHFYNPKSDTFGIFKIIELTDEKFIFINLFNLRDDVDIESLYEIYFPKE